MDKIKIDLSDPETKAIWETCLEAKKEVASWPAWKRGEHMGHGCHDCGVPNGCECPGTHGDWYNQRYKHRTTDQTYDQWRASRENAPIKSPPELDRTHVFVTDNRHRDHLMERCKDHLRYQVKLKPRSACERCWTMWLTKKGLIK